MRMQRGRVMGMVTSMEHTPTDLTQPGLWDARLKDS